MSSVHYLCVSFLSKIFWMVSRNWDQSAWRSPHSFLSELRQALQCCLCIHPLPSLSSYGGCRVDKGTSGCFWPCQECRSLYGPSFRILSPSSSLTPATYSFTKLNSWNRPKCSLSNQLFSGLRTEVSRRGLSPTRPNSPLTPQRILHKPAD